MDGIKKGDIMEVAIPSLKNANMNWKERRKWLKVAKLKRMETMAHGEIKPSKVREKYDVYFGNCNASLYKSYNCKEAIEKLAEEEMKESFSTYTPPTEDYILFKIHYEENPTIIKQNGMEIEATAVVACFVWIMNKGSRFYFSEDYETLFYYVDDSFEL